MAKFTDITILLDRSGSMESIKTAMESGFDEFLQQHKAIPTTRISLIQFDGINSYDEVYIERPITEASGLNLRPRGWTPLLDAMCKTIDKVGQRLAAKREADRPDKVLFLVITDGEENASREFKREDVRKRVTLQTEGYKWQFVYLGANQDAFKEAASFGIKLGQTICFSAASAGTQNAWRSLATNTASYASNPNENATLDSYTQSQRDEAMEDNTTTTVTLHRLTADPYAEDPYKFPRPE